MSLPCSCSEFSSLFSPLFPSYINRRATFQVTSSDIYGNRHTLEGLDFIVIVRKVNPESKYRRINQRKFNADAPSFRRGPSRACGTLKASATAGFSSPEYFPSKASIQSTSPLLILHTMLSDRHFWYVLQQPITPPPVAFTALHRSTSSTHVY